MANTKETIRIVDVDKGICAIKREPQGVVEQEIHPIEVLRLIDVDVPIGECGVPKKDAGIRWDRKERWDQGYMFDRPPVNEPGSEG